MHLYLHKLSDNFLAWFAGSAAMGFLYEHSPAALIAFSVALQLAAIPVLIVAERGSVADRKGN